jgi:hypothetical protein
MKNIGFFLSVLNCLNKLQLTTFLKNKLKILKNICKKLKTKKTLYDLRLHLFALHHQNLQNNHNYFLN